MESSENILSFIQERGVTLYKLSKDTGISESTFSKWKSKPTTKIDLSIIIKIADYFNVGIDTLLGRKSEGYIICDNENSFNVGNNSNQAVGSNNTIIQNNHDIKDEKTQELFEIWTNLDAKSRTQLLSKAYDYEEQIKKK